MKESTQPVEPTEEPVNMFNSIGWKVQKPSLSSGMLVQPIEIEPHPIEYQSNNGRGSTVTFNVLNAND